MVKIIKKINKDDIKIIKALQHNNPNILHDFEDMYQMIFIKKTISIDINDPNQKAFSELLQTAHYMNLKKI